MDLGPIRRNIVELAKRGLSEVILCQLMPGNPTSPIPCAGRCYCGVAHVRHDWQLRAGCLSIKTIANMTDLIGGDCALCRGISRAVQGAVRMNQHQFNNEFVPEF
jgi:hypothetical protein